MINGQTFDLPVSDTVAEDTSSFELTLPGSDGTKTFSLWNFTQPPNGSLSYKTNASSPILLYTPDLNFAGSDTFDWNGSESGVYSPLYQFTITVTDVPDTPVIYTAGSSVDSRALSVAENETTVATVTISDPDSTPTLTSDLALFEVRQDGSDPKKWYLELANALDYETQVLDTVNWTVTLTADDTGTSGGTDTQTLSVSLTEVDEAPIISFGSTTIERTMSEDEIPTAWPGLTLSATDPEGDTISWSVTTLPTNGSLGNPAPTGSGGTFDISSYTPDEHFYSTVGGQPPADEFVVRAAANGKYDYITVKVNVERQDDDAPVFTSSDATILHNENTQTVITVVAEDPDDLGAITYSLASGIFDNDLFSINIASGVLTFDSSPDFETPTDADLNNVYNVEVTATDTPPSGGSSLSTIQSLTIDVQNVNETPVLNQSGIINVTIDEDTDWNGTTELVPSLSASDEDIGDTLSWRFKTGYYPSYGSLSVSGTGTSPSVFLYSPDADEQGDGDVNTADDNFTIEVYDGNISTAELTFRIFIRPVEDEPRIYRVDNNQSLVEGDPIIVYVDENNPADIEVWAKEVDGQGIGSFELLDTSEDEDAFDISTTTLTPTDPLDPVKATISFEVGFEPDYEIESDDGQDGTYVLFVGVEDGNNPPGDDEIEIHIKVNDVNEAPAFDPTIDLTPEVEENQNFVLSLSANDEDAAVPNYHWEIIGGTEENFFELNATSGNVVGLYYKLSPDYENPLDVGSDNTYEVQVKVWDDASTNNDRKGHYETIMVSVADINDAPVLSLPPDFFVAEPSTFVADLNQSAYIEDEDNFLGLGKDEIRWDKIGGADEDLFYLDPNGSLYFRAPSDADGNSTSFALEVNASDGRGGWDSGSFNIEVTQVQEPPEFPFTGPFAVDGLEDNDTYVAFASIGASDPEDSNITWSVHTDPNATKGMLIMASNGFTYRPVTDMYGESSFTLTASDGTLTSDLNVTVYVQPVNDAPTIEYDESAYPLLGSGLIELDESTESQQSLNVVQLDANDSRDGEPSPAGVVWSLVGKDDNSSHTDYEMFYIDAGDGLVSFREFPDYETMRSEANNTDFEFKVYLTDRDGESSSMDLKVRINSIDEAPVLLNLSTQYLEIELDEDSNRTVDLSQYAQDPEGLALTWNFVEVGDDNWDENKSTLSVGTGLLSYWPNADFNGIDYFNAEASDPDGNTVLLRVQATVHSINDLPSFTWPTGTSGQDFEVLDQDENELKNLIDFNATDIEDGTTQSLFTWSLDGFEGNQSHLDYEQFKIDSSTGVLSFRAPPNREDDKSVLGNNEYSLRVVLRDRNGGEAEFDMTVRVDNVEEAPEILNYQASIVVNLSEDESPVSWDDVWTDLSAEDQDLGDLVYWYHYKQSEIDGTVNLNTNTGALSYTPDANYAGQGQIHLGISNSSTDPGEGNYDQNVTVTVIVEEQSDAPQVPAPTETFQVNEGETDVGELFANDDMDNDDQSLGVFGLDPTTAASSPDDFIWTIDQQGTDWTMFNVENVNQRGVLSLRDPADYQAGGGNTLEIAVSVNDGGADSSIILITVEILPAINNPPVFDSFSTTVDVNESDLSISGSFSATDPEGDPLTYSVMEVNGTDYERFTFADPSTPTLTFVQPAPDFEEPADLNEDNTYEIVIEVSDGLSVDQEAIFIRVGDLNDLPEIDSSLLEQFRGLSVLENTRKVIELTSSDQDGGGIHPEVLYSIQDDSFGLLDNSGQGTFSQSVNPLPGASGAYFTVVGDVNRDGHEDFVSLERSLNKVALYLNKAGNQFGDFERYEVSSASGIGEPDYAVLSDMNEDGWLDLIVAYYAAGKLSMFKGDGTTFGSEIDLLDGAIFTGMTSLSVVDLDQDDDLDIVALSEIEDLILWVPNSGKPSFDFDAPQSIFQNQALINGPRSISMGDLDRNGFDDLAIASYDGNFTAILNFGEGNFSDPYLLYPTSDDDTKGVGVFISIVDLNNDGFLDFVTSSRSPDEIRTHYQTTEPMDFETTWSDPTLASYASSIAFVDLDADGDSEILISLPSSDRLAQYVNKGNARDFEKTNEWVKGTYSINHISLIESNQKKDRLTYSISGGKDRQWFEFDSNYSGKLMFINAPDFEEPLDTDRLNEYEVKISVSDGNSSVEEILVVSVENENEAPIIDNFLGASSATHPHLEHELEILTYTAKNEGSGEDDPYQQITYEIVGGVDAEFFVIGTADGVLSFKEDPDFDAPMDSDKDQSYHLIIQATDDEGASTIQELTIEIQDGPDKPEITYGNDANVLRLDEDQNDFSFALDGTDFYAFDPDLSGSDAYDSITWEILVEPLYGTAHVSGFTLSYVPNLNINGSDELTLRATDIDGFHRDVVMPIEIKAVNDTPEFITPFALEYAENQNEPIVLNASDVEEEPLTWEIIGGADETRLFLDEEYRLTFGEGNGTKDFENPRSDNNDSVYEIILRVSDGNASEDGNFTISITNVNDFVPEILNLEQNATTTKEVMENELEVMTIRATDGDADDNISLVYGIVPDFADFKGFEINATTGELTFRNPPDYEAPSSERSIDGDNLYYLQVSVSDGDSTEDNTLYRNLIVSVQNANESAPDFEVSGGDILEPIEHQENQRSVMILQASDDLNASLTYRISGGSDDSAFELDPSTNELRFLSSEIPDWENPSDSNTDGKYEVYVSVTDGEMEKELKIYLEIINEDELPYLLDGNFSVGEDSVRKLIDFQFVDPDSPDAPTETYIPTILSNGTLGLLEDDNGTFYYSPIENLSGVDSLEIQLELDDVNLSFPVSINILEENDPPVAMDDDFVVEVSDESSFSFALLKNDTIEPDKDEFLTILTPDDSILNGSLVLENNQSLFGTNFTFIPYQGFIGDTSFTYEISDGRGGSDSATVNIRVATSRELPGWYYVGEFGSYFQPNQNQNWIFHENLGWLYVPDLSGLSDSTWIWSDELGWLWTGNTYFKDRYLYSDGLSLWLRWEPISNGSDWVLIDYTESEKGRTITRKDFQVEKIQKEIEALPSAISVSRYVRESPIFSEEEKLDIIRELLFTGSSPILLTYGIELSF